MHVMRPTQITLQFQGFQDFSVKNAIQHINSQIQKVQHAALHTNFQNQRRSIDPHHG